MTGADLALGLLVAAGVLAGVSVAVGLRASINPEVFVSVLRRLFAAGNAERARKLCVAAGDHVPSARGVKAMLQLATQPTPTTTGHDYRDGSPGLEVQAAEQMRAAYAQGAASSLRAATPRVWGALAAAAFVGAALLWPFWLEHPRGPLYLGAAGAAALALLLALRGRLSVQRQMSVVLAGVIEPVVKLWLQGPTAEPPPPTVTAGSVTVDVHEPGQPKRTVSLTDPVIKVGRDGRAQLQLAHGSVARLHAVIENLERVRTVIDLGSDRGTLVNGRRVTKETLRDGDTVLVGEVRLEVHLPPDDTYQA